MIDDNIYLSNFSVISYLGHFLKKIMKVKKRNNEQHPVQHEDRNADT